MNLRLFKTSTSLFAAAMVGILATGCATSNPATSSTRARALKPAVGPNIDLTKYQVATVLPFEPSNGKVEPSIGAKFATDVAIRLQADFGPIFQNVRKEAPPIRATNELIVTGTIRDYRPGDRALRGALIGLGAASFKGDLILKDGVDNHVLFSAPFDKLWAWGGYLGMSKGIEDIIAESAASVANTVARAKGWQPAAGSSKAK